MVSNSDKERDVYLNFAVSYCGFVESWVENALSCEAPLTAIKVAVWKGSSSSKTENWCTKSSHHSISKETSIPCFLLPLSSLLGRSFEAWLTSGTLLPYRGFLKKKRKSRDAVTVTHVRTIAHAITIQGIELGKGVNLWLRCFLFQGKFYCNSFSHTVLFLLSEFLDLVENHSGIFTS